MAAWEAAVHALGPSRAENLAAHPVGGDLTSYPFRPSDAPRPLKYGRTPAYPDADDERKSRRIGEDDCEC